MKLYFFVLILKDAKEEALLIDNDKEFFILGGFNSKGNYLKGIIVVCSTVIVI